MSSAIHHFASDGPAIPLRRRISGFVLALVVELLIIVALFTLGSRRTPVPPVERRLTTFSFSPSPDKQAATKPSPREEKHTQSAAPPAPVPQVTPRSTQPIQPPQLLTLSKDDYAAMDIFKMSPKGGATGGSAGDSKAPYGPGEGPGGEPLYNAEWYREPTHAEIATYMPALNRSSWGEVACRTIEKFHVENCRELAETPGSGLARAMRLASWQFLVRPPRMGGKTLIGAWVRIRFDMTVTRGKLEDEKPDESRAAG